MSTRPRWSGWHHLKLETPRGDPERTMGHVHPHDTVRLPLTEGFLAASAAPDIYHATRRATVLHNARDGR